MVSKCKARKLEGEQGSGAMAELNAKLLQLIKEIQSERIASVGDAVKKNCEKIHAYVSNLEALATSRDDCTVSRNDGSGNLLSLRMSYPLFKLDGLTEWSSERDDNHGEEISISSPIRLPLSERIPPYTTWMFLDRNQRMADDQSVIGRRRIYYDQHGSEALVCSDSEDELVQLETEKHEFSEGEDRILRLAIEECGHGEVDLDLLAEFVGGTHEEIQERCNTIMDKCKLEEQDSKSSREGNYDAFCDKSLSDALDSFDNLFCRRCLVFDCRLHGCSQAIIYSNEKQPCTFDADEGRKTCGQHCYRQLDTSNELPKISALDTPGDSNSSIKDHVQECDHASEGRPVAPKPTNSSVIASMSVLDDAPGSSSEIHALADVKPLNHHSIAENEAPDRIQEHEPARNAAEGERKDNIAIQKHGSVSFGSSHKASHDSSDWKPLEKDLYLKGLEIFGRNSCFIARNLLPGLKTCKEVSSYMYGDAPSTSCGSSALFQSFHEDRRESNDRDVPSKSRMCRKRGRVRKVKSSWKSAGHPSLWRRIADGNYLPCKHYTPCGCQPMCGKECPCLLTGTCCEKYCGCSINCKNRFRGCHCTKSQCKSRLCPCFAAGRECDPDVCRYCWVSCGGHELREPARRGENQCGNMKLLLRQQQRILLAKSDVAGWGAFLKNSVNKNDYLGEYTGELISHQEADKRGKIYDRANSSFLFDLNDKFVLDAYRKGDKLKFANHSSTPNCYAKVMLVVGDHRVGIYANEHIEAGQELFYDYRYGPDQAPSWAQKPESSKRDGSPVPQGRTKKHQSG